jgi:hypothetical protein
MDSKQLLSSKDLSAFEPKITSSLRPAHCRFCKTNSVLFIQHYDADDFSIITCTGCLHSRMQGDPLPVIMSPYGKRKTTAVFSLPYKKDLTGDGCVESNPGPPKEEQKAVQTIMNKLNYLENKIANQNQGKQKKKKANKHNTNINNNNNSSSNLQNGAMVNYAKQSRFNQRINNRKITNIKGSELIGTQIGSTGFASVSYSVNPGLPLSFPVLSQKVKNSTFYRFNKLTYKCMTRSATNTLGNTIISPIYNANALPPQSEQQATDCEGAVEGPVWQNLECKIDTSLLHKFTTWKLIRAGEVPSNLIDYDGAEVLICTAQTADNTAVISKIIVEYDVDVCDTINLPLPGSPNYFTKISSFIMSALALTNGVSNRVGITSQFDPLYIGPPLFNIVQPPAGNYLVNFTGEFRDSYTSSELSTFALALDVDNDTTVYSSASNVQGTVFTTGASAAYCTLNACFPVTTDGTHQFRLVALAIGAFGTLSLLQGNMTWQVV